MEIIIHRRNSIESLNSTKKKFGVEVDIRSYKNELIINHDPFLEGINFEKWIKKYNHGTLIINVKEEGIEKQILIILQRYGIKNYFFLDQSFPSLMMNLKYGCSNFAVRISDYESPETAFNLKGIGKWIWIDIFEKFNLTPNNFSYLKKLEYKICLASPELNPLNGLDISFIKDIIRERKLNFDAVCTKYPEAWEEI